MENEIIKVIDALSEKLGVAIDWSAENVLPQIERLIEQYARYLLVSNVFIGILSFIAFAGFSITIFTLIKAGLKRKIDILDISTLLVFLGVSEIIAFASLVISADGIIKSLTIPEIYAAQQLLEMIK